MTTVYPSYDYNAPCHKAQIISDWFLEHDNEFTLLKWPPQSPDLNPIEHLWDVVEQEIRIMDVQPTNLQQLRDAIMSIWTNISEECFQHLVESMPRRIKAVMKVTEYKASCYALRRAIRAAKRRYREKIESHFQLNDSRRMWQGLKTICSSGNNSSAEVRADPLLAEELNTFYGRFECNGGGTTLPSSASESSRQSSDVCAITFSEDDVRRELRRVNVRKAAGPDGITGCVLRSCADQLAGFYFHL